MFAGNDVLKHHQSDFFCRQVLMNHTDFNLNNRLLILKKNSMLNHFMQMVKLLKVKSRVMSSIYL